MDDRLRTILEHMLEDANDAVKVVNIAESVEAFYGNMMWRKTVIMSLLSIGELASHLPKEFSSAHSDIPWRQMIGMRNYAAHGYRILNIDTVWETVTTSIPELIVFLESQLNQEE
jgi:uncharacterized protein with HEPN domain